MHIYLPEVRMKNGEAVDYRFNENLSDRFDEFAEGGLLELQLTVSCSGDKVLVIGEIEASAASNCSRCLEPFDYHFKNGFSEAFTILKTLPIDNAPDSMAAETANMLTVTGDYLYLDEYIRQMIILAQEYSPLCKQECKGICAGCGTDLNRSACRCSKDDSLVDVRLHKLKELSSGSID